MTVRNRDGTVRILLVATRIARQEALEGLIKSIPGLRLAGSLQVAVRVPQHVRELSADAILIDVDQPNASVLEILQSTGIPAVVLVDDPEAQWTAQAIRSGAQAILSRDSNKEEIVHAMEAVLGNNVLLDIETARSMATHIRPWIQEPSEFLEELTARESEVLGMLAEGLGNREMGSLLGISEHTVKFHVASILEKLGAATRTEAVTLGIRRGLILI